MDNSRPESSGIIMLRGKYFLTNVDLYVLKYLGYIINVDYRKLIFLMNGNVDKDSNTRVRKKEIIFSINFLLSCFEGDSHWSDRIQ